MSNIALAFGLSHAANMIIFIIPFGRFCFQRLPFGITSALEFFQKKMSSVHIVLKGMVRMFDWWCACLLFHLQSAWWENWSSIDSEPIAKCKGYTLNKEKIQFWKTSVQVLGQMIDDQGVRIRPLSNMPA